MHPRQAFKSIMMYEPVNNMPVIHWNLWPETRKRWIQEGLPEDNDLFAFFKAQPRWARIRVDLDLRPPFEEKVLEETSEHWIVSGPDGVVRRSLIQKSAVPQCLSYRLKSAKEWPQFKERLRPCADRLPADLDDQIALAEASGLPVAVTMAPLMGWIRNWMGVENMSFLFYEAPEVYREMVDTLADLTCWALDAVVPRMKTPPDLAVGWEDICFSRGPLVSPGVFEMHVAPAYLRIRSRLDAWGIPFMAVDCDGFIEPLLPLWLEAGVNLHYPVEIGTWQADPMALRKKFGRGLLMMGGFDKRALALGKEAIDAEIERRRPIMEDGGFILMPDHHIPPDVALSDYQYYLDRVRNLKLHRG